MSLVVEFVSTLAAALVGSLIGVVSRYFQGWIDSGLMRGGGYFDGIPIHVAGAGDCGCLWP